MNCCGDRVSSYNKTFNSKVAIRDLKRFVKKGPSRSSRMLINSILRNQNGNINGKSILDIGSGIGALGLTLNEEASLSVTCVDVSLEYLKIAEQEVISRGLKDKYEFINSDVLKTSNELPPADIVTLDKAICCYEDFQSLVQTSVQKSKGLYGIVIPRDTWWVKATNGLGNFFRRITKNDFRTFVHPIDKINDIITSSGFVNVSSETAREWLILVFLLRDKVNSN